MGAIAVVEARDNLIELVDDFIVSGHVSCQNAAYHAFTDALESVAVEPTEDVGRGVLQNVKGDRTVVIFQWANVVVA